MKTKYIFLDIDGVLWTVGWSIYTRKQEERTYTEWDNICTSNLQYAIDKAKEEGVDVKIVISSTWRLIYSIPELKDIAKKSGLDPDLIVGVTARFPDEKRGAEIQDWMNDENIQPEDIVIIDDDSDMLHLMPRLLHTDAYDGLVFTKTLELLQMLGVRD
jgi:hypothetical protein